MSRNILYVVSSICLVSSLFGLHEAKSSKSCPFFTSQPPTEDAYSPINIITKTAIPANTSSPVIVRNGLFGPLLFKNTGKVFEVEANPLVKNGGTLHGGVLCDETFILHDIRHWFSQDPNGRAYNEINGKGSPLSFAVNYYNSKYGSLEEALKHADGVVVLDIMVTHGPVYNVFFVPGTIILLFLFHYPSAGLLLAPEILFYLWFNYIFYINDEYYAFRGSYLNLDTGKEYPNVIHIQAAGIFPVFTRSQLGSFQSLVTRNGTRINAVEPLKHGVNQPIYLGKGLTETYSIF